MTLTLALSAILAATCQAPAQAAETFPYYPYFWWPWLWFFPFFWFW